MKRVRECQHPRCKNSPLQGGLCERHGGKKSYNSKDSLSDKRMQARSLYSTSKWVQIRKRQLSRSPLCERCMTILNKVRAATCVDHVEPHNGDEYLFFNNKFQSLCTPCHSYKTGIERKGLIQEYGNKVAKNSEKITENDGFLI